jgi:hypothetical protein
MEQNRVNIIISYKLNILKFSAVIILPACIFTSCTFMRAYSIALANEYDGKIVIRNEKNVISYLENE